MADEPTDINIIADETDDYEADQNLLGFFRLLLEVDRRIDPQFYKKLAKEQQKAEADKNKTQNKND